MGFHNLFFNWTTNFVNFLDILLVFEIQHVHFVQPVVSNLEHLFCSVADDYLHEAGEGGVLNQHQHRHPQPGLALPGLSDFLSHSAQMSPPSTQQSTVSHVLLFPCAMCDVWVQCAAVFASLSAPRRAVTARSSVYKLSVSGGAERWAPRLGSSLRNTPLDSPAQLAISFSHRKCYRRGKMFILRGNTSNLFGNFYNKLGLGFCSQFISLKIEDNYLDLGGCWSWEAY